MTVMSIWIMIEMRTTPLRLPNDMVSNLGGLVGLLVSYRMPLLHPSKSMPTPMSSSMTLKEG
jgi:hypothetical protein